MPILSVNQISSVVEGEVYSAGNHPEITISSLAIDSRTIFDPESSLFFALKSERNDGHRYVADLVHLGVRAFVVSDYRAEFQEYPNCVFIVVNDTLKALQKLAAWHRSQFQIPVVGITGSNGKTIVKEWLYEVLHNLTVIRSPKSYNSQVGVPLSVWNLSPAYDLAIFEAGISMPGEMQHLTETIRPTVGILTNIGEAHQENFASKEVKLNEKLKLFESCASLIYCKDQAMVDFAVRNGGVHKPTDLVAWSFADETADLYFRKKELNDGVEISTAYEGKSYQVWLPFQDDSSIENAGHCLA
ncbi:MAG: bifunctional UDP-N-acetylmuramoyl-tripeptide:D-alanyl-D-alanine ligase/alanine racemase, partial [Prolixibacteraceae bacterium]|nr:bifunctional UDP-N-acetylmuramoyl-tripeptide:D-alanyl-D-alanine ligase/alanine racemase [Prolixibacteraceae bacterium]